MNPIELAAQKFVLSVLDELKHAHLAMNIEKALTLGKVSDDKIDAFNADLVKILKKLEPFIDVIDTLIPKDTPIVGDLVDWVKEVYKEVIEN